MSNVQPIHPNDSWIVDESNRVVGVQTKNTAATFGNVTATTNPLTGGSIFSVGGDVAQAAAGIIATRAAAYGHYDAYSGNVLKPFNWSPGGRVNLTFIGDSIAVGLGSTLTQANWWYEGYVGRLREFLIAAGYIDGGEGFIHLLRTTTWVKTGTWTQSSNNGPSGQCWIGTGGAANYWTLVTPSACDNIDIIYRDGASAGDFEVTVDGGAATTIVPPKANDNTVKKYNISCGSLGVHTIVIKSPATGNLHFLGAAIYKGSSGVVLHNLSKSGSDISDYQATNALHLLSALNPKITFVSVIANDYASVHRAIASYKTYLTSAVNAAKLYGSVIGIIPPDNGLAPQTPPLIDYETAAKDVVLTAEGGTLDIHAAWGSYASNLAKMNDTQHPNAVGHTAIKELLAQLCMSLGA